MYLIKAGVILKLYNVHVHVYYRALVLQCNFWSPMQSVVQNGLKAGFQCICTHEIDVMSLCWCNWVTGLPGCRRLHECKTA